MDEWAKFKKELLKDDEVAVEYKKLEPKYRLISQLIAARVKQNITQKQLAKKIGTKQSSIARLESGSYNPSLVFLGKIAKALDTKVIISLS